ncbi:cupin domain-containing protein [Pseudomonas syringae]|nr:cupin domain-containing protein [Pseudomonas syringae]
MPLIYKPVLEALERLNIQEEGLEFFRLHIEEDEDHAITMLGILDQLTQNSPEAKAVARQVGRETILKRCAMFDAIWSEVRLDLVDGYELQTAQVDSHSWLDTMKAEAIQLPRRLLHTAVDNESRNTNIEENHTVDLPAQTMRMALKKLAPNEKTRLHRHNYETIIYVLTGSGSTYIEDRVLNWEAGDAIYVPAWAGHYHANNQQHSASYIACENSPQLATLGRVVVREEL